ncbi:unnamed protein product [Aureobasidium pullulans]|nr:unnamed protein product [Aureobasidium pullulans]
MRTFTWLGITDDVRRREKALQVPDGLGTSWSIDFVVALPESRDHNGTTFTNIMTATDRFTKRKHFVLMRTITTVDAAYAMLHVIKLHGLPQEMSNGQDENTNQQMEQYLRAFVNLSQDDWVNWLPLAEFALNNRDTEPTGVSPFFADCGRNMRKRKATATIESLAFRPGDIVWLSTRNLTNRLRPAKKLDNKRIGPFKIAEAIPSQLHCPRAYKLLLPSSFKLSTNTFHVSLLTPVAQDALPGQTQTLLPPVVVD